MAVVVDGWPFTVREAAHAKMNNKYVSDRVEATIFGFEPVPKVESVVPRLRGALQTTVWRSSLEHGARKVQLGLRVNERKEGVPIATHKRVAIRPSYLLCPKVHSAESRCQRRPSGSDVSVRWRPPKLALLLCAKTNSAAGVLSESARARAPILRLQLRRREMSIATVHEHASR